MSKNIITIDVGNSNVSILVIDYNDLDIKMRKSYPTNDLKKNTLYEDILDFKDKYVPSIALISSVAPKVNKLLTNVLDSLDIKWEIANPLDYANLMCLDVKGAKELGADIFFGCIRSAKLFSCSITIDMGTAITLALVKDNHFLSCAIYPGVYTAFNSLFNNTELVNEIDLNGNVNLIGGDTTDAIRMGSVYGTVGALKEMISKYKELYPDAKIVFTGGASKNYIKYFDNCYYERDLIHFGLVEIYLKRIGK